MGKKKRAEPGLEEEEAFPRGGGSGLAPIEKKRLQQEAYAEAEADLAAEARGKKGGKRRKAGAVGEGGDEEDAFFSGLALQDKLPKFVELLKFKNLSKGCKLWGAVIEVTPQEVVVSLPHGLRGHVAYGEASDWLHEQAKAAAAADSAAAAEGEAAAPASRKRKAGSAALPPLTDLFSIGQLVGATVVGLRTGSEAPAVGKDGDKRGGTRRKRVDLSLRVSKLNGGLDPGSMAEGLALTACVRSEEDHGYVLALGVKGVTAFLPKKAAAAAGRPLAPGALLEVVVPAGGGGAAGAVLSVECSPAAVASAVARDWEGLNIGSLVPGQLVTARVRHVLSDGLICSFLTYFTGTVDPFHLGTELAADWRKQFSPNQRLRARILFVDPASKRVGLTLQRHLLAHTLPPNFPMLGQVFDGATVRRVDEGLGLLLELPPEGPGGAGVPLTPGYAHVSAVAEERVEELGKSFRPGQRVKARVLGFRPMDGLAVLSLKRSVVESSILSIADVRPGQAVSVTVVRVEEYGLLVSLSSSIRALVHTLHASDLGSAKALRKFKQGQVVAGRVLTVDTATKKVTVTLKPSLVGSRLPPIVSLEAALPGSRSHGVVTGATDFGVFVSFYGGVGGLAHVSECGLAAGQKPGKAFTAGQVVKCRVLGLDRSRRGIKLSLVTKAKKTEAGEAGEGAAGGADAAGEEAPRQQREARRRDLLAFQPGSTAEGTVTAIHTKEVDGEPVPVWLELAVSLPGVSSTAAAAATAAARLEAAHLADHPTAAAALLAAVKVGSRLGPLLVLQRVENKGQLQVTRKPSLLAAAGAGMLPAAVGDVREGQLLAGYVASVTADAVFVRFLDGLTARAGLAQLSDTFVSDPHLFFKEGQSVRAAVVQVDAAKQRFSVTLKQSLCSSTDASYLRSLFGDLEAVGAVSGEASEVDWSAFAIGATAAGQVHEVKQYGLLCDLAAHADVVGLASPHQVPEGAAQAPGTAVQAVVLDVNKRDGIVDLSLQPRLVAAAAQLQTPPQQQGRQKKKQKKGAEQQQAAAAVQLAEGQRVEATVELVKGEEGYCVVSLAVPQDGGSPAPAQPLLGFLPTTDFNLQHSPHQQPPPAAGQSLAAAVAALPSAATGGRLLLTVPLGGRPAGPQPAADRSKGGDAATKRPSAPAPAPGSCVEATVAAVHALHADLALPGGARGRLHASQSAGPLTDLGVGATLQVAVLGRAPASEGRRSSLHECSARPDAVAAAAAGDKLPAHLLLGWGGLKPGQQIEGHVEAVDRGFVWCAFSPSVRGRAFASQAATTVEECEHLGKRYKPGQAVHATVLDVDRRRHVLDLSLLPPGAAPDSSAPGAAAGTEVGPAAAEQNSAAGPGESQAGPAAGAAGRAPKPGQLLLGRISAVGGGGILVQLGAHSAGRVPITEVHDAAVQDALAGLAVGQYCRCAVLGADPAAAKRPADDGGAKGGSKQQGSGRPLLLSLRPSAGGQCRAHGTATAAPAGTPQPAVAALGPGQLKPGQRVAGYVKSSGAAGVFVCLARNLDARIRLSHLADEFVEEPAAAFPPGRLVVGQVLAAEEGRVSLTLRSRPVGPSLEGLQEGQVVRGRVKKVEKFGVFVELEGSAVSGLAHVSEVADDFVKDLAELFTPGQRVAARVLKVDAAAGRLSLGLKPSYLEGLSDLDDGDDSDAEQRPDFDAELEAAGSSSDEEGEPSGSEEEAEDGPGGSSSGEEGEGSEEKEEEEEEEDFDLDEELAEAGSSSDAEDDSG